MGDPSGRFKLIPFSVMLQRNSCGACGRVGRDNDEPFVDPQMWDEFVGSTYFCQECTLEMAALYGAVNADRVNDLLDAYQAAQNEIIALRSSVVKLEKLSDYLTSQRLIERGVLTPDLISNRYVVDAQAVEQLVQDAKSVNQQPNELEPKFVEPSADDGPDDVSEPTSSNIDEFLSNL